MPVKVESVLPTKEDLKVLAGPIARGTLLGSFLGVLPGGGALLSSFASYTLEKKLAGERAEPAFGQGNIRGVAGPESANNAGLQTSFIPMLTLGIPSNAVMALMIGAMMIHDITPGPQVMNTDPELFWGLIVLYVDRQPHPDRPQPADDRRMGAAPARAVPLALSAILAFCCIGVYWINNNVFDVWMTIGFGALGYLFNKLGLQKARTLILGFILGPMTDENMRRALLLSRGDMSCFLTSARSRRRSLR